MLKPTEIQSFLDRADQIGWMQCDENHSPCGCLAQAHFAGGYRFRSPEVTDRPIPELGSWLADCGVRDDAVTQIVYSEDVGVELPWRLVAQHMATSFLGREDQLIADRDGKWMLGVCHHDILTFGRI